MDLLSSSSPTASKQVLVETANGETYLFNLPDNEFVVNPSSDRENGENVTSSESQSNINQCWAPTQEEKMQLKIRGQSWNQGIWSKEESDTLKHNILIYCENHRIPDPSSIVFGSAKEQRKDFYKTVAKGINRPLFAVYRRILRMYDSKNHIGKYSHEELEKLRELRKQYGNDWQKIGTAMGRSAASIKDRCRHLKDDCNSGPWTPEEEDQLSEAVYALTQALPGEHFISGIPWIQVAKRVGTRSERQCRKKWLSYYHVKRLIGTEWSKEDDLYLINRLGESEINDEKNINWPVLARNWPRPSVVSHQWLRGKWWRLKSVIKDHQHMALKDICRQLSIHYMGGVQYVNVSLPGSDGITLGTEMSSTNVVSVVGIIPAITTSMGVNFNVGLAQSSVVITPPCVTNMPMYLSCPVVSNIQLPSDNISFVSNVNHEGINADNVTVLHVDLDGGEDSAVTTDVMLCGGSLCAQGSPLGLVDKLDEESDGSSSSK